VVVGGSAAPHGRALQPNVRPVGQRAVYGTDTGFRSLPCLRPKPRKQACARPTVHAPRRRLVLRKMPGMGDGSGPGPVLERGGTVSVPAGGWAMTAAEFGTVDEREVEVFQWRLLEL
jgi:hypothetical protein